MPRAAPVLRSGLLSALVVAAGAPLAHVLVSSLRAVRHPDPHDPLALVAMLTAGCAVAVTVAWLWVGICVGCCLLARARHAPDLAARVPRWLHLVVAVAVGAGPGVAGAQAAPVPRDGSAATTTLPHLHRPLGTVSRSAPAAPGASWVVRDGDSLWSIAARWAGEERGLPPGVAEVDARWRAIYTHNRSVIGPDPDLIHPGTRLFEPSTPRGAQP